MSNDLDALKALTFDVFGTVVDWRSSISREIGELAARKGFAIEADAFADAWRGKYQPSMERIRSGDRPFTKLDVLHRENLLVCLQEFKIDVLDEDEIDELNRAWHRLSPWPDSVAGITRMKRDYIMATLSNGNIALMVNMAKNAGLPWDVILGAEVARAYKPQPEAYLRSAEALGLEPWECMLVAAHNNDLVAAAAMGYRTAFVRRSTEYGPNQTADLSAEHDFDIVCESMEELAERLGC